MLHEVSFKSFNERDTVYGWIYVPACEPKGIVQLIHGFGISPTYISSAELAHLLKDIIPEFTKSANVFLSFLTKSANVFRSFLTKSANVQYLISLRIE